MKSDKSTHKEALVQVGLTRHQAAIYSALVKMGRKPASTIAHETGVSRPLTYKALDELESMELVEKHDAPGKVAEFSAAHPLKLQDIVARRFETAQRAKESTESVLSALISDFTKISGQPGVRILQGPNGVKELYADVLRDRQPIMLIRSPDDKAHPEVAALIEEQIKNQVRLGITTRAITPLSADTPKIQLERDTARLLSRRIVPMEIFAIPAQVLIYGNKVSFTAFDSTLMTTIVENPAIARTATVLFEYMWSMATPEHERMRVKILERKG